MKKMMAEDLYDVKDPKLVHDRDLAKMLYDQLNHLPLTAVEEQSKIVKQLFGSTGENVEVRANFYCDYGYNIHVGENFFANYDCLLLDTCPITIGKNALLAPRVQIYAAGHPFDVKTRNSWLGNGQTVTIGDNCWIGGNAIIVPGVTLGNNVIVGAGSVVTKSFGDDVVVAGNPARVIKTIGN
ncbi:sugar O-acetyltransferase [Paucilactobacillus hokkaidonensis]|uniref:sugar O-acetyltransferase n=1 Tax=Paucilactobacillus hokkaidonensis TaxID=1193095 RepID=UPI0006D11085|nr:sugar O-acetyltransferase [Paucilactobacillus hokkaidonensis]